MLIDESFKIHPEQCDPLINTPAVFTCSGCAGSYTVSDPLQGNRCRFFTLKVSVYEQIGKDDRNNCADFNVCCFFENSQQWKAFDISCQDALMQVCGELIDTYTGDNVPYPATIL